MREISQARTDGLTDGWARPTKSVSRRCGTVCRCSAVQEKAGQGGQGRAGWE